MVGREICFLQENYSYKILPVHHHCNPNDQQNSHKLQIRTASSKNRKMNFRLEIKLTVNSSWFREAMWAKHKQSEIRMVRRNSTNASSDNCLYRWGEKFTFWNKFVLIKYCQYTWLQSEWSREFAKAPNSNSFLENRKVNFCLELKLTVNWSKWSWELAQGHVPKTAFIVYSTEHFFLRIGNGLTSFWLDESVPIKMHARMRDWLPWSKPVQSKKSQRPILTNVCHFWDDFLVEFTQRLHIYMKSYTYLGCSFRWSLLFCCVLLVFLPKREKENWCTADFFSRSSRGQIRKQCNVYNT